MNEMSSKELFLSRRVEELEGALKQAAETLMMLDEHTHPSIECDAAAQSALDVVNYQYWKREKDA